MILTYCLFWIRFTWRIASIEDLCLILEFVSGWTLLAVADHEESPYRPTLSTWKPTHKFKAIDKPKNYGEWLFHFFLV